MSKHSTVTIEYKMGCIPKKFLCRYPLDLGALVVGAVMLCILILFGIVMIVQLVYIQHCDSCKFFAWRNCFAYSITGFVYIILMISGNLWFMLAIKKKKSSVVLSWIVVSSIWLSLVFVLLIVLIFLHISDGNNLASVILTLVFGLIAIGILLYGLMVVLAFWLELKQSKSPPPETASKK